RQAVHHGGEHAHGVAGRARHAARGDFDAANDVAAADHNGHLDAELLGRNQIVGNAVNGRLVDAKGVAAGEILARELDHDATIDRLSHCLSLPCPAQVTSGAIAPEGFDRSGYFLPLAAATSAAKSDSCFSIPSPRA